MEGGTYLLAGLLLSGIAELDGLPIASLPVGFLEVLDALGVEVTSWHASRASGGGGVRATCSGKISAVRFSTAAHPGFPTDLQPQMAAFLSQAHGMSRITETVYDKRDSHIRQLEELGVKIDVSGRTQTISGPQRLVSGCCSPRDIRCAAAVVVAAAASKGTTGIVDDGCLRRGYSNLLENLDALGLDVRDVYTL